MLGNQLKVPVYLIITFYLRRNSIWTTAVESLAPDFSSPITLGSPRKAVFDLNKGEERFTEGTTGQITDSFGWGELASKGKASQESSVPSASGTLPKLLPDNQISEINTVAEEGEKLEIASYERPVEERKIASSPVRNERKNKKSRKNKNKRKNKNQTKNVEAVPKEAPGMKASFLPENEVSGVQSRQLSHYNSKESDQSKKQLNQDLDRIIHELTSQSNISLKQILPAKEEPDAASSISNSIQWIFNSERELEEKMSEEAIEKIKRAFQPNPSENPGEIYPGVIKGIFSEIVHTSQDLLIEIVQSIPSSEESIEALSSGDLIEKVSQNHTNLVVKIFGNQLQISNAQNNIPLQEMSEEIYTKLKLLWNLDPEVAALGIKQLGIANCKLNKYEFLRRTITLANQIVQKTILENWVLVKQNLIEKKEEKPSFLNKVEDYFKLQTEFPDPLTWANTKYTKYYPEDKTSKNPQKKANSLYRSVVGISENNRRLQAAHDFIKDSKKMKMQQEMKEKLQKAERLNGVSILNVSHFIHYLGLGQSKNVIQSWDINKVIQHIQILNTIISSSIWHTEISWYKSADRAWLREFFGEEYDEKLKLLCQRASGVQYWEYLQNPLRYWPEDSRIEPDLNHERISEIIDLMDYRDEQRLIVMEHGLNGQIIGTIRLLKDQHTNLEGHTKWESVWNSFPLEFQISPEQKEFAKYWIDDISKQGIDLLFFGLDHERRID